MFRSAKDLTAALGGRWHGSYGTGRCPAHDDRTPSLSIGERDGRVLIHCHAGCTQPAVIGALQARGLWPDGETGRPEKRGKRQPETQDRSRSGPCWRLDDAPAATRRACDIWRQHCGLFGADTAQGRYLIGRGLPQPWPETLAAGDLPHPETGEVVPTLIVARHCPVVHLVRGIQRIFLTADGKKYPHGTVKMSLGSIEGGRAELLWPDADLAIAEGVESALSAWRLLKRPAWAMCGPFPESIQLPGRVRTVTLVADHDPSGGSERKARALARSIRAGGRQCTVIMPDSRGADANDVLVAA